MRKPTLNRFAIGAHGAALLALALVASGCSGGGHAPAAHPETFEAAKALAASRNVPILVDFFSPT